MIRRAVKKVLQTAPARAAARHWTRRRPVILMYHGITADGNQLDWTQVTVADFEAQMKYVRDSCNPVSLDRLIDMQEAGKFSPHTIAVTFDDGYKSNLDLALPILEQFSIPATVFVTSKFIDGRIEPGRFLWPDVVTMVMLSHPADAIDLTSVGAGKYELNTVEARYRARHDLVEQLKSIPEEKKHTILQLLVNSFGGQIDYDRFPDYRPLSRDELMSLSQSNLVTIGAHTRTHPILRRVDHEQLDNEVIGGKRDLEKLIASRVELFAYPNGRLNDINEDAVEVVRAHFRGAVLTEPGLVRADDDRYLLRRVGIGGNLSLSHFKTLLSGAYYLRRKPLSDVQRR